MVSLAEYPRHAAPCQHQVVSAISASAWYAQYSAQYSNTAGAYTVGDSSSAYTVGDSTSAYTVGDNTSAYMVGDNTSAYMVGENTGAYMVGETRIPYMIGEARIIETPCTPLSEPVPAKVLSEPVPAKVLQVYTPDSSLSPVAGSPKRDLLSNGSQMQKIEKDTIPLVSLGCACGPKLAFKELGRGAETLPFDWITTTSEGVLQFLRSGFQGFFDFQRKVEKDVGGVNVTAFRSAQHGFWHDDPTSQETHDKYNRRFKRMLSMDAKSQPVLFVRLAATTEEIRSVDQFLSQLTTQFGPQAYLLLIIDCQGANAPGPCMVKGHRNLLIHYVDGGDGITKFCDPIDNALDWVAGGSVRSYEFQDLKAAHDRAKPATPGFYGMGGLPAFEGVPEIF